MHAENRKLKEQNALLLQLTTVAQLDVTTVEEELHEEKTKTEALKYQLSQIRLHTEE